MNDALTDLMHKHLNATLTPEEAASLANAMLENPGFAEEFAALTRLDADLTAAMKDGERTALYTRRMERAAEEVEPAPDRKRFPAKSMAAAAGLAVLIGAGWSLLDGLEKSSASKKQPGKSAGSGGGGNYASMAGISREEESAAMKRKLRRFYVPAVFVRSQPVSQALAHLQTKWREASPKDDKEAAAFSFALSDKLRQRWLKPDDEPAVSLEIPGISMLANLELVAAQSGLKSVITAGGVTMEEDTRKNDDKERTWTIALPQKALTAFVAKVSHESARWKNELEENRLIDTSLLLPDAASAFQAGYADGIADSQANVLRYWMDGIGTRTPGEQSADRLVRLNAADFFLTARSAGPKITTWDAASSEIVGEVQPQGGEAPIPMDPAYRIAATEETLTQATATDAGLKTNAIDALVTSVIAKNDLHFIAGDTLFNEFSSVPLHASFSPDGSQIVTTSWEERGINPSPADSVAALGRLLAAHGMPETGVAYDAEAGILTARGNMQSLRAANAAAAAILESSSDGVSAEIKLVEWKDNNPPPAPDSAKGTAVWLAANEIRSLLKLPNASLKGGGRASVAIGGGIGIADVMSAPLLLGGEPAPKESKEEVGLSINSTKHLAGDSLSMEAVISYTTAGSTENATVPVSMTSDGGWLRYDFPATANRKAATAIVHLLATTVDQ
jgi:hypothetical protein